MLNHLLRYEPVVRLVEEVAPRTLLEAGSGSRGLSGLVADGTEITACDVSFEDYGSLAPGVDAGVRRVTASVLDLPFADGEFDCVVALDLLEHLEPAQRPRAVAELARVAGRRVIVGCPTGRPALRADRRLAGYVRRLRRPRPVWLDEHLRNGFPQPEELGAWVATPSVVIRNERLTTHFVVCALEATPVLWRLPLALSDRLRPLLRRGGTPSRAVFGALRGFDGGPGYRTIVVADFS
jgi:hypothetical protein